MNGYPKIGNLRRSTFLLLLGVALGLAGCVLFGSEGGDDLPPEQGERGFFRITSPDSGDRLHLDSSHLVQWTSSSSTSGSRVRISLFQQESWLADLSEGVTNSGSFAWTPALLIAKTQYQFGSGEGFRIRLASVSDTNRWDFSESFSLTSDLSGRLQVTAPRVGESVRLDSAYTVTWQPEGQPGPILILQLMKGGELVSTLDTIMDSTGSYVWSRPVESLAGFGSGPDYRIRIFCKEDPSVSGFSPVFSMVSQSTGGFTIKSPLAGESHQAGVSLTVSWAANGNPGTGAQLSLWRDSVRVAVLSEASPISGALTFTPDPGLPTSNRYRICVASLSDPSLLSFSGYFKITGAELDSFEPDDKRTEAKTIAVDGQPQQRGLTLSDEDWVAFQANPEKRYWIRASSATMSLYLDLLDSSGKKVDSQLADTKLVSILAPTYAGTHYVRITPYTGMGSYTLTATEYDSSTVPVPIPFTSPNAQSMWLGGARYSITYTPDTAQFGRLIHLDLYQGDRFVTDIGKSINNSGAFTWTVPSTVFPMGQYRIRISRQTYPGLYAYSGTFHISGTQPDDYEPDYARGKAKTLLATGMAQNHTLSAGDEDWMVFQADSGTAYSVRFQSNSEPMQVAMWDANGAAVADTIAVQMTLGFVATKAGACHIRVTPNAATPIAYTATLSEAP